MARSRITLFRPKREPSVVRGSIVLKSVIVSSHVDSLAFTLVRCTLNPLKVTRSFDRSLNFSIMPVYHVMHATLN